MVPAEHSCECPALEARRNFRGKDIVLVLDALTAIRGAPAHIRSDNGPELASEAVKGWCEEESTCSRCIAPARCNPAGHGENK